MSSFKYIQSIQDHKVPEINQCVEKQTTISQTFATFCDHVFEELHAQKNTIVDHDFPRKEGDTLRYLGIPMLRPTSYRWLYISNYIPSYLHKIHIANHIYI